MGASQGAQYGHLGGKVGGLFGYLGKEYGKQFGHLGGAPKKKPEDHVRVKKVEYLQKEIQPGRIEAKAATVRRLPPIYYSSLVLDLD